MKRKLLATITTLSPVACGPLAAKQDLASRPSIIVGHDDQMPLPSHPDHDRLLPWTGAIGKSTGGCTAFHLGNGLVATAGHCITMTREISNNLSCPEISVHWDNRPPHEVSKCVAFLAYERSESKDYAFFMVDPAPEVSLPIGVATLPSEALVLGYPSESELSLSGPCPIRQGSGSEDLNHDCDTRPGNSGSPIFSADKLEVIGIHNGGYDDKNYGTFLSRDLVKQLTTRINEQFNKLNKPGGNYDYGPFANNRKDLIHYILQKQGKRASFVLHIDVEDGFDEVRVTDDAGLTKSYTGTRQLTFTDLRTPVLIDFVSDYAGNSKKISVQNVVVDEE